MIDLDRITNDPTHEHYAYRPRPRIVIPLWPFVVLALIGLMALCH